MTSGVDLVLLLVILHQVVGWCVAYLVVVGEAFKHDGSSSGKVGTCRYRKVGE